MSQAGETISLPIDTLITGQAPGADSDAEAWAKARGLQVHSFPADWKRYGRRAGPIRNAEMAKGADALIAFPGGKGTANMLSTAKKAHLRIIRAHPRA